MTYDEQVGSSPQRRMPRLEQFFAFITTFALGTGLSLLLAGMFGTTPPYATMNERELEDYSFNAQIFLCGIGAAFGIAFFTGYYAGENARKANSIANRREPPLY
jgi:hypothetical protein